MIALTLKHRTGLLANVEKTVSKRTFAPTFDVTEWKTLVEGKRQQILQADTVEAFENEIQKLIAELKQAKPHGFLS